LNLIGFQHSGQPAADDISTNRQNGSGIAVHQHRAGDAVHGDCGRPFRDGAHDLKYLSIRMTKQRRWRSWVRTTKFEAEAANLPAGFCRPSGDLARLTLKSHGCAVGYYRSPLRGFVKIREIRV
jgi:hypothetical protein